jgi:hypothetical protein
MEVCVKRDKDTGVAGGPFKAAEGAGLEAKMADVRARVLLGAYCFVGLAFTAALCSTLYSQPLFPFRWGKLEWCQAWLLTTVGDYYVLAFGLSTIIWLSEESKLLAALWIVLVNVLGSPFCMFYLACRVYRHGSVGVQLRELPDAAQTSYDRFA